MPGRFFHLPIALLLCAWFAVPTTVEARQPDEDDRSIPDGFEDLVQDRRQMVDVVYQDRTIGVFEIVQSPDTVQFSEPETLLSALPKLTDSAREKLSMPLARNQDKACPQGLIADGCGYLTTEDVGIIHTAGMFRVELFIAATAIEEQAELRYLPNPGDNLTGLAALNFVASGGNGGTSLRYSANASSIVSVGAKRLITDLEWTDELGVRLREGFMAADLRTTRAYAGLFESRSYLTQRNVRILGVGFGSQLDTLLDRDRLIGSPLVVFLRDRGRVEVFFDGRLLSANTYPSGNVQLDTSNFPEGSYELEIRITDGAGPVRIERRLFVKDSAIPLANRSLFFIEGGLEQPQTSFRQTGQERDAILRAGGSFRLAPELVAGAGIDLRAVRSEGTVTLTYFSSQVTALIEAALSEDGVRGSTSVLSNGSGPFGYGGIIRYEQLGRDQDFGDRHTDLLQASGYASWTSGFTRFSVLGDYRSFAGDLDYSISATGQVDIARSRAVQVSLVADGTLSSTGDGYFVGVRLNLLGSRGSAESVVGVRSLPDRDASGAIWNRHSYGTSFDVGERAELGAQGFGEFGQGRNTFGGATDLRTALFDAFADFTSTSDDGSTRRDYSLGAGTSISFAGRTLNFSGKETAQGLVHVAVAGGRDEDRFEVYVDGQLRGAVTGSERLALQLPVYRQYTIRLKPFRSGSLSVEQPDQTIVLYPGNVIVASFEVTPLVPVLGRLMLADGSPLRNASISWKREIARTDDGGYFQIEATSGAKLSVLMPGGGETIAPLPTFDVKSQFENVGKIIVKLETEDDT